MEIDQPFILEYLQYERDDRWKDLIEGGFTEEEAVSPIKDWTDIMLIEFISNWTITQQNDINQYWKNYSDEFDNATANMCWEDLLKHISQ
jgi:hypothetical protein